MSQTPTRPTQGQSGQPVSIPRGTSDENVGKSPQDLQFGDFPAPHKPSAGQQSQQPQTQQPQTTVTPPVSVPSAPQPPPPQGAAPAHPQPQVMPGQYPMHPQPHIAAVKAMGGPVPVRTGSAPPTLDTVGGQAPHARPPPHFIPQHTYMAPLRPGMGPAMGPGMMVMPVPYGMPMYVPPMQHMHPHAQHVPHQHHAPQQQTPPHQQQHYVPHQQHTPQPQPQPQPHLQPQPQQQSQPTTPAATTTGTTRTPVSLRHKLSALADAPEFKMSTKWDASAPAFLPGATVGTLAVATPAVHADTKAPAAASQPAAAAAPAKVEPVAAPAAAAAAAESKPAVQSPGDTAPTASPAKVESTATGAATLAAAPATTAAATAQPAATVTATPVTAAVSTPAPASATSVPATTASTDTTVSTPAAPAAAPAAKPTVSLPTPAPAAGAATAAPVDHQKHSKQLSERIRDRDQKQDNDLLSAFTAPKPEPPQPQPQAQPTKTPPAPVQQPETPKDDTAEWELNVERAPPVAPPSPVKKYTFDEMMALKAKTKSMAPPADLGAIDSIKVSLRPDRTAGGARGGDRMDHTRYNSGGGGDRRQGDRTDRSDRSRGGRGDRSGGRGGGAGGRYRQDLPPAERLLPSETGYKIVKPTEEIERIKRQVQSLLNKLTPEKFDKLYGQLLDIDINDRQILEAIIEIVFKKAVDEPGFSPLYADLCLRMADEKAGGDQPPEKLKFEFPPDEEGGKPVTFKRLLLNRCQAVFESKAKPTDAPAVAAGETAKNPDENAFRERRTMLGNIKFIGELFRRRMLVPRIMIYCIDMLLERAVTVTGAKAIETDLGSILPHEEMMEGLCKLLTTIGAMLDDPRSKCTDKMDELFTKLKSLMKDKDLYSSRIRFMVQDVVELRDLQNWVPRQATAGPKKLDEIKREQEADPRMSAGRGGPPPKPTGPLQRPGSGAGPRSVAGGPQGRSSPAIPAAPTRQQSYTQQQPARGGKEGMGPGGRPARGASGAFASNAFGALADMSPESTPEKPLPRVQQRGPAAAAAPVPVSAPEPEVPPPPKSLSEEEALRASEQLIEEYMDTQLYEEAARCVSEIHPPALRSKVVESGLRWMLEQHDKEREQLADLFDRLGKDGKLTENHFAEGFTPIIGELEDLVIDYPNLLQYLSLFVARTLVSKSMPPAFLRDIMEEAEASGREAKLLALVLNRIVKATSAEVAAQILAESKLVVDDVVPPAKFAQWIEDNGLAAVFSDKLKRAAGEKVGEFLAAAFSAGAPATIDLKPIESEAKQMPLVLLTHLARHILADVAKLPADGPVKPKTRVTQLVQQYTDALKTLAENDQVGAVASFVDAWAEFPDLKTVMLELMLALYDNDVVDEDSFRAWKDSTTNITDAKQKAIVHSVKFFQWLDTADEEDETDAPAPAAPAATS